MFEKIAHWFSMDSLVNWAAGAGGVFIGLMGGWDALMKALIICMVVDYVTGVANAIKEKRLSSQIGFVGILRKLTIFGVVIVAAQIDQALGLDAICRTAAVAFYTANEAISVTENAAAIGLPIPKRLEDALGQLKDGGDKAQSQTEDETKKTE